MDSSIPIWVPIAIGSGIAIWALLSVLGSERQRRQFMQPTQVTPLSPPVNSTNAVKAPVTKVETKKPDRAAA